MAGYRITERTLKSGKISKTVIIDKEKISAEEKALIMEFYVPAGYVVKYKGKDLTKKDIIEYLEQFATDRIEEYQKMFDAIKGKKKKGKGQPNFMSIKKAFKDEFPNYPDAPESK